MQSFFVFKGVRGYSRLMELRNVMDHPKRKEIEKRVKIIGFFEKHGAEATQEAYQVARSTVYSWKKKLKDSGGELVALAPRSRRPHRMRQSKVSPEITAYVERYRTE